MIGSLAKKMRILGFDCRYFAAARDDDLIMCAHNEDRIILTRDCTLAQKCKKRGMKIIFLQTNTEREHLVEIAKSMGWSNLKLDIANTRCTVCNGQNKKVQKQTIASCLPPKVAERIEQFWQCASCKKIYWAGTHIRNVEKLVDEINAEL
jgi:uncharacterized protein with PIN domain